MRKLKIVLFLKKKALAGIRKHKIKMSCVLMVIFCVVLVICFFNFAKSEQKLGVFYDFWSEAIFECILALLAEGGIVAFIKFITQKKVLFLSFFLVCGTVAFFSVSGILKIQSMRVDEELNDLNNSDKDDNNAINETKRNKSNNSDVYTKIPYVFENDSFFEKGREEYFGIKKASLTEKDEIVKHMADVIFEDMQSTKAKDEEIPESYCNHTQAAELLYDTYESQCDMDLSKKGTYAVNILKEKKIQNLDESKKERISGDEVYQDSENRRLISVNFKELGDEYQKDNNQEEASKMFEESVEWAMRSLYTAYANKNYEKMKKIYEDLNNAISAWEKVYKTVSKRTKDIRLCCDAYKLIIDEYLPI